MTDLLPCPFCGGEATVAKGARGWKVECEGRFGSCLMNARTHYQPQKFMAATAWNTRAPGWQPIETAPDNVDECLLYVWSDGRRKGQVASGYIQTSVVTGRKYVKTTGFGGGWDISHWMPLPTPPE